MAAFAFLALQHAMLLLLLFTLGLNLALSAQPCQQLRLRLRLLPHPQGDSNRSHNAVGHASSSCGRVLSLAHSPFLPNALLAVADCGFLVWQAGETLGEPLFESRFSEVYYTCGCWSPTKPGQRQLGGTSAGGLH